MSKFRILLTGHAVADLSGFTKETRNQIHRDLRALESAPFPSGAFIKRLKEFRPPVYRLRSGDFRVLYHIKGEEVAILRVIDRKVSERVIKRLKL
jgi:mRNA-degrading endonuclease RelE of RelBE toxin-antitoxin system